MYHIKSYHIISYHITLHHITSQHITSHIISHHITSHIITHHIISYHVVSYRIISYHITSHHTTPHHITSHHTTSHHITSHHITSHHIIHEVLCARSRYQGRGQEISSHSICNYIPQYLWDVILLAPALDTCFCHTSPHICWLSFTMVVHMYQRRRRYGELAEPYRQGFPLRWRHNGPDCVSNHQPHDCLLNRLLRHRSEKTSKLRVTGRCAGKSPGTGEFPAQRASYAENVSIWWRHHA